MAIKDRATLKSYFETFDKPTETEFGHLIDSMILNGDSYNMDVVVPYSGNWGMLAAPGGTTDYFNTNLTLGKTPIPNTGVRVSVNGLSVQVGNGLKTKTCYFSRNGGVTALGFSNLQIGDTLYWNGIIAGYNLSDHRIDFDFVYLNPTTINFSSLEPVERTGTLIKFDKNTIYGTPSSPETSNITDDLAGAYKGLEAKIYHNSGTTPTFPAHWVNMSSNTYITSQLNTIKATLTVGGRVEYVILQDN